VVEPLLKVVDLVQHFRISQGFFRVPKIVRAVDGVNLEIHPGKTLGLVGESGCGKSTLARSIIRLYRPTSGKVLFQGSDLAQQEGDALLRTRQNIQMVFQDPHSSLNPRMTIFEIIREPLDIYVRRGLLKMNRGQIEKRVLELMDHVGLSHRWSNRYPHEFSGGQRQRVGIARALALSPKLILADEPVSSLDVSIQAQILNLIKTIRREYQQSYLFISHDLAVVQHICDTVAVMYLGVIVEKAPARELARRPLHPYSQALYSAAPIPDPIKERARRRIILQGDVPSPVSERVGCYFHDRCPHRMPRCQVEKPQLQEVEPGRSVACFLYDKGKSEPR
jgi:oligopeptide transport system ATP-binding protein